MNIVSVHVIYIGLNQFMSGYIGNWLYSMLSVLGITCYTQVLGHPDQELGYPYQELDHPYQEPGYPVYPAICR